jgi:hypothetical protein
MADDAGASGEAAGSSPAKEIVLSTPFQRKKDVFDAEDFQPAKFINQIYPDGARGRADRGARAHDALARARARPSPAAPHGRRRAPRPAEASLGDLDKFMDMLRKQAGSSCVCLATCGRVGVPPHGLRRGLLTPWRQSPMAEPVELRVHTWGACGWCG